MARSRQKKKFYYLIVFVQVTRVQHYATTWIRFSLITNSIQSLCWWFAWGKNCLFLFLLYGHVTLVQHLLSLNIYFLLLKQHAKVPKMLSNGLLEGREWSFVANFLQLIPTFFPLMDNFLLVISVTIKPTRTVWKNHTIFSTKSRKSSTSPSINISYYLSNTQTYQSCL